MPKLQRLKPAKKANTRARADKRVREMHAREPAGEHVRPTRDVEGLKKVARLMSGVASRAAGAYADARIAEGDKFIRLAQAGYREAMVIFEEILKGKKVLGEKEQEDLITTMNQIKLLNLRVSDYAAASKDEAWRREHTEDWNPHPLGEDKQGFFAKETY
ncbi:MAG TPA: hypothetical protein PKW15_00645 [Alphaproteobacteria bacterium]|nr:hypothetical protein [Alphaproteobacteria bacterium]